LELFRTARLAAGFSVEEESRNKYPLNLIWYQYSQLLDLQQSILFSDLGLNPFLFSFAERASTVFSRKSGEEQASLLENGRTS
jgi:hypothetical protein